MGQSRPVLTCGTGCCRPVYRHPCQRAHHPVAMPAWVFVILLLIVVALALVAGRALAPTSVLDRIVGRLPSAASAGGGAIVQNG